MLSELERRANMKGKKNIKRKEEIQIEEENITRVKKTVKK